MRRNVIFILMSIEIMLNAAGLAFVVAGSEMGAVGRSGDVRLSYWRWRQPKYSVGTGAGDCNFLAVCRRLMSTAAGGLRG